MNTMFFTVNEIVSKMVKFLLMLNNYLEKLEGVGA